MLTINNGMLVCISLFIFILFPCAAGAKSLSSVFIKSQGRFQSQSENVSSLENRLRPYLEHRVRRSRTPLQLTPDQIPDESDFLLLARVYNNLSPQFRALYKAAMVIPSNFKYYISPSGHFEVYYTKSGTDAVDSTDKYGYADLHTKVAGKNGIPDYIDEVAWALDSAWSMEIDRFGFIQPIPYIEDDLTSDRYKVIIEEQDSPNNSGTYGLTFVGPEKNSSNGYSSLISMRNEWSGSEWRDLGYYDHPENGVRVTCAHEFFHAIQYAMSWNTWTTYYGINLDDFPISWIEGSAVLMEDLAFNDINDYLQYANIYFDYPTMQFLNRNTKDNFIYCNSILLMYLYNFASDTPSIDLIKNVFMMNYRQRTPFYEALESSADKNGTTWIYLLNRFQTYSFFTGKRADTTLFIKDAPLLNSWNYTYDILDESFTISKDINPNAMDRFTLRDNQFLSDTVNLSLYPATLVSTAPGKPTWAARAILIDSQKDTVLPIALDMSGIGTFHLAEARKYTDLILVVTNGDTSLSRTYTIVYNNYPLLYSKDKIYSFKTLLNDNKDSVSLSLKALSDLYGPGPLNLTHIENSKLIDSARLQSLQPEDSLFEITYPSQWGPGGLISMTINVADSNLSKNDTFNIYRWSYPKWNKVNSTISITDTNLIANSNCAGPGIYGIFRKSYKPPEPSIPLLYPNVISIRNDSTIHFKYGYISEIKILTIDGELVDGWTQGKSSREWVIDPAENFPSWKKRNAGGKSVSPGLYFAIISYHTSENPATKVLKRKILLYP